MRRVVRRAKKQPGISRKKQNKTKNRTQTQLSYRALKGLFQPPEAEVHNKWRKQSRLKEKEFEMKIK